MLKNLISVCMLVVLSLNVNAETKYTSFTLDNGLQAYLIEDHRQPIAVHMLWYNAGSGDETLNKSGLAHLLEHLMFKGTDKIPPQEFSKMIARLGGIDNASTSPDYTNYYQLINTKNIAKAMSMEADRMENLKISEDDFQTERKVVIQERKQRIDNSPFGRFYEKIMTNMYDKHPYRIITTGTMKDLDNLTRQDALDWYEQYYAPNNAILLVVGDMKPEEFKTMVEAKYKDLKPKNIVEKTWPKEPLYNESRKLVVHDEQVKSPTFYRIQRVPSFFEGLNGQAVEEQDVYNLIILADILASSNASFLYNELVLDKALINDVSTSYTPIGRSETSFDFYMQVKDTSSRDDVEKALTESLNKFIQTYDNKAELEVTKTKIKSTQVYAKDDAMTMSRSIGKFLSAGGTIEQYDEFFTNLDSVTLESLKETAKKYFNSNQHLDAWLVPEKETKSKP